MRASVDILVLCWSRRSITFLYFFIHRHNESKRRLKNVSLTWVFLLLWCISGHTVEASPLILGVTMYWGGCSTRLFCCVWASRVSGTCEPCMPTLAWAAGILHVRKLMRLFSCKTQFKPHNSWQFDNEAAWTPVFFALLLYSVTCPWTQLFLFSN